MCCATCRPRSAILDGELVASDRDGHPDFRELHRRSAEPGAVHLWAFDLLALNGRDLRPDPLVKRQARLQALLERFDCPAVLPSEVFDDGLALLRVAEKRRLEGVVSQAPGCALPVGRLPGLAQGQDDGVAGGEPGAVAAV